MKNNPKGRKYFVRPRLRWYGMGTWLQQKGKKERGRDRKGERDGRKEGKERT
jgi:hypothetical protein